MQAPVDVETPDFGALGWESSSQAGASEGEKKKAAAPKGWKGVGEWQASRQLSRCTPDTLLLHPTFRVIPKP